MGIRAIDFRRFVVQPALDQLRHYQIDSGLSIENLLMATAAQESQLGEYLQQTGGGPGVGPFQMEYSRWEDTDQRMPAPLRKALASNAFVDMHANLFYAATMCRIAYWLIEALPPPNTFAGLWGYYKPYWNSRDGAATEDEFRRACDLAEIHFPG